MVILYLLFFQSKVEVSIYRLTTLPTLLLSQTFIILKSYCTKYMVTCHFTANWCCETFPECCETFPVCCETFPDRCENFPVCCAIFPDCCESFPECCETFPICNQTFSVYENCQDKVKGWVRGISLQGLGSKVV